MEILKNILVFLLKIILTVVILLVIIAAGLLILYFVTIQSPLEYLPPNFVLYAEVESIQEIYDNVIDLRAADVILLTQELKSIYSAVLEFKSNEFTKNDLFRMLLNIKASVMIDEEYSPTVILDPGLLSLVTRALPIINLVYRVEELDLKIIQKDTLTIYNFTPAPDQDLYLSVVNNLVFLSTKQENIEKLYSNYETQDNLKNNSEILSVKEKLKQGGFIELYLSTQAVIDGAVRNNPDIAPFLKYISFNSLSTLSFHISNTDLKLSGYTNITTLDDVLNQFLDYTPSNLKVIQYLPSSTNLYFSINFKSFKDLYQTTLSLQGEDSQKTMEEIEDTCDFLFNAPIDDLIFDWTGSEAGFLTVRESMEPVFFIEVNNEDVFHNALDLLVDSIVFKEDADLVLDNVRLNRIKFPGLVKRIAGKYIQGIDTPYFVLLDDFLFLSMDPENLANLVNNYKSGKTLVSSQNYKDLTQTFPKNANIFLYYDLSSGIPKFLSANNLLNKLLSLYERGLICINFTASEIAINISASGIAGAKTMLSPGFPKYLEKGVNSEVIYKNIKGSNVGEFIYIDGENNLVVEEYIEQSVRRAGVDEMSSVRVLYNRNRGIYELFVFSPGGTLYKFDPDCNPLDPFPIITNYKNSFPPVEIENKLLFYSDSDSSLYLLSKEGQEQRINVEITSPVLSPPNYLEGVLAFYAKTFSGLVYLTDLEGNIYPQWPQEGGGISYCSPLLYKNPAGEMNIIFLTQAGILNVWDIEGKQIGDFPVQLEGVYYANPVLISYLSFEEKGILALDENGLLTLVSLDTKISKQKKIENAQDKRNKIVVFDFDSDGIDEIFIYGASNYIVGLNNKLEMLPGFPVKGSMKPAFTDINFDGYYEMLVASYDGNLYAYTLNK
jgi:hypothetical protein